jgi:hypothetical protein
MRRGERKKGAHVARRKRAPLEEKPKQVDDRDFPEAAPNHVIAVCKRCHCPMGDTEPGSHYGEFYHPSLDAKGKPHTCVNTGKCFTTRDLEIEPFMKQGMRRRNKRNGVRA